MITAVTVLSGGGVPIKLPQIHTIQTVPLTFSHILVKFINSVPKDKLTWQKMHCCNDMVHSELFHSPECRQILLPVILAHVKSLMESGEELEVCVKMLSDIMDLLYRNDIVSIYIYIYF